jgi:hypothetical protein
MAREKHYRGFTYHYDLGRVKVARPIPKALGKAARAWLDCLGLDQMQLMLVGRDEHDPLSSGSGSLLFKGEEMLPPGDRKRIIGRDFDCICIIVENDEEGKLFKKRDRLERIVLRELVYIARPETRGNPESALKIVDAMLAQTGR